MPSTRVYCDTGAYSKELRALEEQGRILLHQFKYENPSRKIPRAAIPSDLRYEDLKNYTYDDLGTDEVLKTLTYGTISRVSDKYGEITSIVGAANRKDAQHLDSAYMTGCSVFITSDKGDIWSNRAALLATLSITVFHVPSEWLAFLAHIKNDG